MRRPLIFAIVCLAVSGVLVLLWRTASDDSVSEVPGARRSAVPGVDQAARVTQGIPATPTIAEPSKLSAIVDEPLGAMVDATLGVTVRHADGAPAAGCVVVLEHESTALWRDLTDVSGRAKGPAIDEPARLWVGGATLVPVYFEVEHPRGHRVLTLPAGDVIEGRVLIDGAPPPEPLVLRLSEEVEGGGEPDCPVERQLAPWREGAPHDDGRLGQLVDVDGAFRFSGLPSGWHGAFDPAYGWFADDDTLAINSPAHGVLLELRRIPHLRLRVVSSGTRSPAAGAMVAAEIRCDSTSVSHYVDCGVDGRADMPMLRWDSAHSVVLDLANATLDEKRFLVVPIADGTRDVDLGDIELKPLLYYGLRVRDDEGLPVKGARITLDGPVPMEFGTTDSSGRTALIGDFDVSQRLRVVAEGYEPASIFLPEEPTDEQIDVVLHDCCSLVVHVATADGRLRSGLSLFWTASRLAEAFDAESDVYRSGLRQGIDRKASIEFHVGPLQPDGRKSCDVFATLPIHVPGEAALGCLAPGTPIDVHLVDRTRGAIWSALDVVLSGQESRELQVHIADEPRSFQVFVTDSAGGPIEDVEVEVHASDGVVSPYAYSMRSEMSDATGRAVFDDVYVPWVDVEVDRVGYGQARLERVASTSVAQIVMSRGRAVRLRCADSAGRPIPVGGIWIEDHAGRWVSFQDEPLDEPVPSEESRDGLHALWRLSDLPSSAVVACMMVGGREIRVPIDTASDEVLAELPACGSLVVQLPAAARSLFDVHLLVRGGTTLGQDLGTETTRSGQMSLPFVIPGDYHLSLTGTTLETGAKSTFEGRVTIRAGETATVVLH